MHPHFDRALWRTSTRTNGTGACVEVAMTPDAIGMRDTKDRSGPVLALPCAGWASFVAGIKDGEFDA